MTVTENARTIRPSVFADKGDEIFQTTRVTIEFKDRIVGGNPKDPKLVEGWIRARMGVEDEQEIASVAARHMAEMGLDGADEATAAVLEAASESMAGELKTQGFKRDENGNPYLESRQIKAGIKESVNVLFAGERWGRTKKGPKSYTAERVFVSPDRLPLGTFDQVKIDLSIGHISGPKGPQSTIGYFEYVENTSLQFEVKELRAQHTPNGEPALSPEQWGSVWAHLEWNGFGAMRSQGYGQFHVVEFEVI